MKKKNTKWFYDDGCRTSIKILRKVLSTLLILVLCALGATAQAQTASPDNDRVKVSGTVKDAAGVPLMAVTVVEAGTTNGTVTDMDGQYSLMISPAGEISVSYVGFLPQSVKVDGKTTINIHLKDDTKLLGEVVVVGYGTMLKSNLSTSVSSVNTEKLNERPTAINLLQALAGKVAGVNIMQNSGAPGGSPVIKIRGIGSLNSSNEPLYVIDGVVGINPSTIDPNIIKSIDVLKDATSSAIYGSRGANGVVVITTKDGEKNTSNITYTSTLSTSNLARKVDVLDAYESVELFKRAYEYAPGRVAPHLNAANNFKRKNDLFNADGTPKYNTDWQDETTRNAFSHMHSLTFSGGGDKLTAVANISYKDNQGIMLNTYRKQLNAFLNIGWQIKDWFHLQGGLNVGTVDQRNSENGISRFMLEGLPFIPVKYEDGSYSRKGDYPEAENAENPVRILKERESKDKNQHILANVIGTFQLMPELKLVTSFSKQNGANMYSYYAPSTLFGYGDMQNGRAERRHVNYDSWTNEDYLAFDKTWDKHNLNAIGGVSWYKQSETSTGAASENFFDNFFKYNNMGVGTVRANISSGYFDSKMNSYYARANYNYDDRYLVGASFRYDGSSRFGSNNRYGFFPSFSGAWRVSNESFFVDAKKYVSDLKLRASYGFVGNAEIGNYLTMAQYSNMNLPFNKDMQTAVLLKELQNADLKWEKSSQLDLGVDISMFGGRVELVGDFYNKITTDLLYRLQLPSTTGYESTMTNLGKIRNRGIELTLSTRNIQSKDWNWTTMLTYTMNRSKVIDINGNVLDKWGGRIEEGRPLNELYGYVRQGTWGTDEAAEAAKYNKKPGDLKYWDKNENGMKDGDDRDYLGNAAPKFEMNMTNSIQFREWTLMFDLHWVYGNKLVNFTRQLMENRVTFSNSYGSILNDAWTPENQNAMVASLRLPGDGYENEVDSRSCESGSFLRLRNIGLKYNFNDTFLAKTKLKNLYLAFNVENAFLITKYKGADPEVTSFDPVFEQGIDFYAYPKPRTYSFSLGVSF